MVIELMKVQEKEWSYNAGFDMNCKNFMKLPMFDENTKVLNENDPNMKMVLHNSTLSDIKMVGVLLEQHSITEFSNLMKERFKEGREQIQKYLHEDQRKFVNKCNIFEAYYSLNDALSLYLTKTLD